MLSLRTAQEKLLAVVLYRESVHDSHVIALLTARSSSRTHGQIEWLIRTGITPDGGQKAGARFGEV